MLDLNDVNKEDAIAILKKMFFEMCSSRRLLKPILADILQAIDNDIFIDADSEEVKELLEEILRLQDRLSQVEDLKKAVSTKKLSVIDDAINEIDRNRVVNELKLVLAKFKNLVCDSEDENESDAAKKLKRQAHKLSVKADKINAELFNKEGSKFIDVADKIENPSKISSTSFLEIQNNFPENKFLAYSIIKKSLHFETEEDNHETIITDEKQHDTINDNEVVKVDKTSEQSKKTKRLDRIKTLIEEYEVPIEGVLIDEDSITVESKNLKKRLSVKSLNNKLHEFVDGSESISFPILRTFCKCRVFSTESIFEDNHEDRARLLIPVIVDKLYNWGIADKVNWQGFKFYYLNDQGRDLLIRALSIKDIKTSSRNSDESPKRNLIDYLRRFLIFSTIWSLKIKNGKNKLDTDTSRFWMRSTMRMPNNPPHIFMSLSLMFLDDNWLKTIDNFIQAIGDEEELGKDIKSVFLVSSLPYEKIIPWIKLFKELGTNHAIYNFTIAKSDCKLTDEGGNEIIPSDWKELISFGKSNF